MPEYKRQHFLPAAFLKYFSSNQSACSRDSLIWRFDGKTLRHVPIISQCVEDYHYSKTRAAETERMFQESEGIYCQCVNKIKAGRPLTSKEYGSLLVLMFDFHLRNAAHKNLTGREGIEAYKLRSQYFMRDLLLNKKPGGVTEEVVVGHIERNWTLAILSPPQGTGFIASDNPSVWTCLMPLPPTLHIVSMPLTPRHIAVAYDKRVLDIVSDQTTEKDRETLNSGQVENARQCLYSSFPFSDDLISRIQTLWSKIRPKTCEVRESGWKLSLQGLPPENYFSFIRRIPPIF